MQNKNSRDYLDPEDSSRLILKKHKTLLGIYDRRLYKCVGLRN